MDIDRISIPFFYNKFGGGLDINTSKVRRCFLIAPCFLISRLSNYPLKMKWSNCPQKYSNCPWWAVHLMVGMNCNVQGDSMSHYIHHYQRCCDTLFATSGTSLLMLIQYVTIMFCVELSLLMMVQILAMYN